VIATFDVGFYPPSDWVLGWLQAALASMTQMEHVFEWKLVEIKTPAVKSTKSIPATWNFLWSEMGGMEGDVQMLHSIAANNGKRSTTNKKDEYFECVPLSRVLDQHTRPELVYNVDFSTLTPYLKAPIATPMSNIFRNLFHLVTGFDLCFFFLIP
jgi:hypothetical protein